MHDKLPKISDKISICQIQKRQIYYLTNFSHAQRPNPAKYKNLKGVK